MSAEMTSSTPNVTQDTARVTASLPQADPWGLLVVGSPQGVGPLCSEAGRLGFELFRARQLRATDAERLEATDWAAALVVDDGSDMDMTRMIVETHLALSIPVIWMGEARELHGRPFVRLPIEAAPERIAATVFHQARKHLYPTALVRELRRSVTATLTAWGEDQLRWGPVWIKNHHTPAFSMTARADLLGDVSGELCLSAPVEWFDTKRQSRAGDAPAPEEPGPEDVAAAMGEALIHHLTGCFQARGADLSVGTVEVRHGGAPIDRRLSHRPALCIEFSTETGEFVVVEFSGTGLDGLEDVGITSDFNLPL